MPQLRNVFQFEVFQFKLSVCVMNGTASEWVASQDGSAEMKRVGGTSPDSFSIGPTPLLLQLPMIRPVRRGSSRSSFLPPGVSLWPFLPAHHRRFVRVASRQLRAILSDPAVQKARRRRPL